MRCGQRLQRFVRGPHARVDAGRAAELDAGLGIEDVAGQRDEHRPGRRRGRDLGGAAHDARQVFQTRHLDRPFHQRLRHLHQRPIQHGLHQPMPLLLLAGGEDHRRAREFRVEQRAHRVAEARRDVNVAGDQPPRGAAVAVGDRNHQALLHRHHVSEVRMVLQRMHDRQLGGAGIAEQMGDAFVLEQRQKGRAAGNAILHVGSFPPARVVARGPCNMAQLAAA